MRNKILALIFGLSLLIGAGMYAADQGSGADNAVNGGLVRQLNVSRWSTTKVGLNALSNSVSIGQVVYTNVVATNSCVLGDVTIVPFMANDSIRVFNSASGAGCSNSQEVFFWNCTNTPGNGGSLTNLPPVGIPIRFFGGVGRGATLGLTTITTHGATNSAVRFWIDSDYIITGRN